MPKISHEAIVQLVRESPSLVLDLLWPERQAGVTSVRVTQTEFVDTVLAEYRADAFFLTGEESAPEGALVIEIQLAPNPLKPTRWPILVAGPFARYRCPVDSLILTIDRDVAAWARRPILVGRLPGAMTITPAVIGPDQIPVITDLDQARENPALAILSALAHAEDPEAVDVATAAIIAAVEVDSDAAAMYADAIFARLGELARTTLEKLMQTGRYDYQSDFARQYFAAGRAEGEAKGEAKAILQILELQGLAVPEDARQRILTCTDPEQLDTWLRRTLRAQTLAELFAD
ncbi:MAG: hypothetical protein IPK80_28980 [Nannocystis sp.]|nr:hypothetical protein [Nannocystis sp.]